MQLYSLANLELMRNHPKVRKRGGVAFVRVTIVRGRRKILAILNPSPFPHSWSKIVHKNNFTSVFIILSTISGSDVEESHIYSYNVTIDGFFKH